MREEKLTREQIEQFRRVAKKYLQGIRVDEVCDLALQSLSQEAVRDEVLEEALNHAEVIGNVVSALLDLNVTYDGSRAIFTFETTDNAMGHIWSARDIVAKRLDAIRALKREPNAAAREMVKGPSGLADGSIPSPVPERPPSTEMVMVPREPTRGMLRAALDCPATPLGYEKDIVAIYRAMLSAAEAEGRKPYAHVMGACPLCGRTDPHSHTSGPLGMS